MLFITASYAISQQPGRRSELMKLFIPTDDPARDVEAQTELPVPYHPDYPCLRLYAQTDRIKGSESPVAANAREVSHGRN
jgi:hypothetical protein